MKFKFLPATLPSLALIAALGATIVPVSPASAQSGPATPTVARFTLVEGAVTIEHSGSRDATPAVVDGSFADGDYVTTANGARAEVLINGTIALRLDEGVQLRSVRLDHDHGTLQLASGAIDLHSSSGAFGTVDVDTPSITLEPHGSGDVRVSVAPDGRTLVSVRAGEATIVTPSGPQEMSAGTALIAEGPATHPSLSAADPLAFDPFDRFVEERNAESEPLARQETTPALTPAQQPRVETPSDSGNAPPQQTWPAPSQDNNSLAFPPMQPPPSYAPPQYAPPPYAYAPPPMPSYAMPIPSYAVAAPPPYAVGVWISGGARWSSPWYGSGQSYGRNVYGYGYGMRGGGAFRRGGAYRRFR